MSTSRHPWIASYHSPNPFARSLVRPFTILSSADEDAEWTPGPGVEPVKLACSRHDFAFPYRNFRKDERIGRGRLWLPPQAETLAGPRSIPLVLSIHYEGGIDWAKGYLAQGWACMTPISLSEDHGFNLVGDGMDHTLAMAELARRLEWVDLQRIAWTGGSAGGYQCLMTLEALWPAACAISDVPISDLAYDLGFIALSEQYNKGITDPAARVIPIVHEVSPIVAGTQGPLGNDPDEAWKHSAPAAASLIRSPVVIHSTTGDLLCPAPQIADAFYRAPRRGVFPPGWTQEYARLCNPRSLAKPLIDWIPREDVEVITVAIPPTAPHVEWLPVPANVPPRPPQEPLRMSKPFSRSHLVTILLQDEGAPDPTCAHSKYAVNMDTLPYVQHHFSRGHVPPEHLTPLVLTRVLGRFSDKVPQNPTLPPIRRLHPEFDRWEALLALETFMGTPLRKENVDTLARLYSELPPAARALDVTQDDATATFAEEPVAGLLFHEAVALREAGDVDAARAREERLAREHARSAFAGIRTEKE